MQNDRLPSLDRLLVFDAAARRLSFTKAAEELHLTQSAVSRQIAALEAELGTALFRRRHRAIELSDEGRKLAATTAGVIASVRETVAQLRAPHGREVVTITTTPGLASLWLIPRLAGFTGTHPAIDVRIDATHDVRALAGDGVDLAIRYGRAAALGGSVLFDEVVVPVCAPSLRKRVPLDRPADLARHALLETGLIAGSGMPADWESWLAAVGLPRLEPASRLAFNHYDAGVAAALAGQGVLLGRRPIIDDLLKRRALVAPLKGEWSMARGYAVLMAPAAARRPAVRALHDWLLRAAGRSPG